MQHRPFQTVQYGPNLLKVAWTKRLGDVSKTIQESIEIARNIILSSECHNIAVWKYRFLEDGCNVFIEIMNSVHMNHLDQGVIDVS